MLRNLIRTKKSKDAHELSLRAFPADYKNALDIALEGKMWNIAYEDVFINFS